MVFLNAYFNHLHCFFFFFFFFFSEITYLGLVGGFDLKDTVWRVLKATFTTPVARGMNWRGVNGKIGVQRLVVKEVIIGKNLF